MALNKRVIENIPFVQAQWRRELPPGRPIQLIVLHSMESQEKGNTAEAVAQFFANGAGGRSASAHYCVDANSIVQCVQTKDIAAGAPGANHNGVHIELAGRASQTKEQWLDAYSRATLENAAVLCAKILCPKFDIPVQFLMAENLKRLDDDPNLKGFTTHNEVSQAFKRSTHWDPGPGFPRREFLEMVQQAREL